MVSVAKEMATVGQEALIDAGVIVIPIRFRESRKLDADAVL